MHRHYLDQKSWWEVVEVDDCGKVIRTIVDCECDEALARRIARLPELEAIVDDLLNELRRMLLWHDAVRRETSIVPSPYYIDAVRAVVAKAARKGAES